jgi:hypothetical protein
MYLSSNAERRQKIKNICRKYQELPPYIVKQIIDWELSREEQTISDKIKQYRHLCCEEKKLEKALREAIKGKSVINNPYIYEQLIMIDLNNGYSFGLTVGQALERLKVIKRIKRNIVTDVRINYAIRPFLVKK